MSSQSWDKKSGKIWIFFLANKKVQFSKFYMCSCSCVTVAYSYVSWLSDVTHTAETDTDVYLTHLCTLPLGVPGTHVYRTLLCTWLGCVPDTNMYLTVMCSWYNSLPLIAVFMMLVVYWTLICTIHSCELETAMYLTLICTWNWWVPDTDMYLTQCVANILKLQYLFVKYILLFVDNHIHLSKYSFKFRATNIFGHLFVDLNYFDTDMYLGLTCTVYWALMCTWHWCVPDTDVYLTLMCT